MDVDVPAGLPACISSAWTEVPWGSVEAILDAFEQAPSADAPAGPIAAAPAALWDLRALLPQVARMDRQLRWRFWDLEEREQEDVIERAMDALLAPTDGNDPTSTVWLDSERYADNPGGAIFEWNGFQLARAALDVAMHQLARERGRHADLDAGDLPAPAPPDPERLDVEAIIEAASAREELTDHEREVLSTALAPQVEAARAAGLTLHSDAQIVFNLLAAGVKATSRISDMTGFSRPRVDKIRQSFATPEFRAALCEALAPRGPNGEREAPAQDSDTVL